MAVCHKWQGTLLFFLFFFWPRGLRDHSSLTRDRTQATAVKALSPNHWKAREFPWGRGTTLSLFFFFKLIYLLLAALGLHCCTQAFSSSRERGLLFVAARVLFIAVASLVAEYRL